MQCPDCGASHIRKNGKKRGKQNHICVNCGRQFIDSYDPPRGYSDDFKRECLKMYVNQSGFRAIERVKGVHHTTVITWLKQVGALLPDAYDTTWKVILKSLLNQASRFRILVPFPRKDGVLARSKGVNLPSRVAKVANRYSRHYETSGQRHEQKMDF